MVEESKGGSAAAWFAGEDGAAAEKCQCVQGAHVMVGEREGGSAAAWFAGEDGAAAEECEGVQGAHVVGGPFSRCLLPSEVGGYGEWIC